MTEAVCLKEGGPRLPPGFQVVREQVGCSLQPEERDVGEAGGFATS